MTKIKWGLKPGQVTLAVALSLSLLFCIALSHLLTLDQAKLGVVS